MLYKKAPAEITLPSSSKNNKTTPNEEDKSSIPADSHKTPLYKTPNLCFKSASPTTRLLPDIENSVITPTSSNKKSKF